MAAFKEWLNTQGKAKLLTRPELARALPVSPYTLIRWRRGTLFPNEEERRRLAKYCNVSPDEVERMIEKERHV